MYYRASTKGGEQMPNPWIGLDPCLVFSETASKRLELFLWVGFIKIPIGHYDIFSILVGELWCPVFQDFFYEFCSFFNDFRSKFGLVMAFVYAKWVSELPKRWVHSPAYLYWNLPVHRLYVSPTIENMSVKIDVGQRWSHLHDVFWEIRELGYMDTKTLVTNT